MVLVVKHLPANAAEIRTVGLIPGSGRPPGAESANPLQYSCLGNPMDGGTWYATVHGVAKSQTQRSDFTSLHRVKYFGIVNKAEVDIFLELSCLFSDPMDAGNLISDG